MKLFHSSFILLAGAIILFFITSIFTASSANIFPDVKSPILREAVLDLSERGILDGYPDGSFRPNNMVNRAETLKMIFSDKLKKINPPDKSSFSDVIPKSWYAPYVFIAHRNNIVKGYPDGSFRPGQTVSRAEFMKMAMLGFRYFETDDIASYRSLANRYDNVDFTDWFVPYLSFALKKELIKPRSTFFADEEMSRGESALFLFKLLSSLDSKKSQLISSSDTGQSCEMCVDGVDYSVFPWAYLPFIEFKNSKMFFQGIDQTDRINSEDFGGVQYFEEKAFLWAPFERLKRVPDEVKMNVDLDFPEYYERAMGINGGYTRDLVHYSGYGGNPVLNKDGVSLQDPNCDCDFENNFLWVYAYHSPIKQNPNKLRFFEWQATDNAKRATYDALFLTIMGRTP